jgi:uncharacterized membrane protein
VALTESDGMESLLPGLYHAHNIHPLTVHFPIAFWTLAVVVLGWAMIRHEDETSWKVAAVLVYAGALGAVAASVAGFAATEKMGHDAPGHGLVHVHRNIMIAATAMGLIGTAFTIAFRAATDRLRRGVVFAVMATTVGLMTIGADRGAELVFRYGIGVTMEAPPADAHDHDHGHEAHGHGAHGHESHHSGGHEDGHSHQH